MENPSKSNLFFPPVSKPESEITDKEKQQMREFEVAKQFYRISDRLNLDIKLKKLKF